MNGWLAKLRAALPGSIGTRGLLLLLIAVAAVAVPAYCGYRLLSRQAERQRQYERETLLAAALVERLEAVAGGFTNHEWVQRIREQAQRVRWAALVDQNREVLELHRRTALRTDEIVAQVDLAAAHPESRLLRLPGDPSQRLELLTLPQPADHLTLAVVLDGAGLERDPTTTGLMLLGLGCAALVGLGLAWTWFRLAIERPIQQIGQKLATVHAGLAEATLAGSVPSELAELVQSVVETRQDLEKWRVEAAYWRNSIDTTVAARTRRAELAQRRAEREAGTDALTRLGNRRVLERELPVLFDGQRRGRGDLSLVVFDIDNFKQLNDTRGHPAGDALLAFLGDLIRASTRRGMDLAVRYGGDEFVLALPDVTMLDARQVARRIARLFAQRVKALDAPEPVPAVSAGIASLRQTAVGSWEELLGRADEAMYWARRSGRGVATAEEARSAR